MVNPPSSLPLSVSVDGGSISTLPTEDGTRRVLRRPTDRSIPTIRRSLRRWASGLVMFAVLFGPVCLEADATPIDPIPVGTAIRGSDLLVPLTVPAGTGTLPERIPVAIGDLEVEADIALLSVSMQAAFSWVMPSRPIEVRSPASRTNVDRDTIALAVVPIPTDANGTLRVADTIWTPIWLPPLPGWDERLPITASQGVDADPAPKAPMEWFRWAIRADLSGNRPPPCRMSSLLEKRVALAVSDEWRAGLRRVREHSPSVASTIGERLVATVEDPERASPEQSVAMWPTDARELSGLRTLLLDFARTDEEVALAGLAWFEVRPPFVAWLVDASGDAVTIRIGNPTVEEVVVLASFTSSDAPEALLLPPLSLTTHVVERIGPAPVGSDEQLVLVKDQAEVRLDVGVPTIRVEPPGASFGSMVIGRTLASVNGEFVEMPALPAQTAGILRRRFNRWEVFVEARGTPSSEVERDQVFVQVGSSERPVAILGVSRNGNWRVESGPETDELSVRVVDHGDRWRFVVTLPEAWLVEAIGRSSEGGVRLGLRRDGPRGIVQFAGPPPAAWKRQIPTQSFGLSWWDDPVMPSQLEF